jgi:hypothetical protein
MIAGLQTIALFVADVERARHFYSWVGSGAPALTSGAGS